MEGTSICVLSMNRPKVLMQTISKIKQYSTEPYEIIIVDNGSTDPASFPVLDNYANDSKITVIRNPKNMGLSIGTNQGLEAGKYDCLIHLDDDCLVSTPGWNQIMRKYLQKPEVGMVVPGTCGIFISHQDYDELTWALGMCWAIDSELFKDIGGYDPQLMHQNECDMALRVRLAGFRLAGLREFGVFHNDPGGPRSDISLAREHLGCVQFRDKWTSYFRGRDWNYGTEPLYLMQHWPPDQEFIRRWALQHGVQLNPPPSGKPRIPTQAELAQRDSWTEADIALWSKYDHLRWEQTVKIAGGDYLIYRDLRPEYTHWSWQGNPDAYQVDRQKAINRWYDLTGELYEGYVFAHNLLRPY